jgi:S-adenosylmethionine-diacylglycerol 3-amino-3-carboxypropyl transferase
MEASPSITPLTATKSPSKKLRSKAIYGKSSKTTLKERIIALWFRRLVYTQIWEDPVVDMQALQLGSEDHVITVASGGCNALSYLIDSPAKVTAVDLNHAHVSLVKLKIAALKALPNYDEYFQFLGVAHASSNVRIYNSLIAPNLDTDSRQYWEGGPIGFRRIRMFAKGFYKYGLLGQIIGTFHWSAKFHKVKLAELLELETVHDQEKWFDEKVAKIFDSRLVSKLISSPFALYNLGIPPSQQHAFYEKSPEGIADILKSRARRLATMTPAKNNYFAWQAFGRCYDSTGASALPPYLMREHYDAMKANANKISVEQSNILDAVSRMEHNSLDAAVLLDTQDWMSDDDITALWSEITRVAKPGARVIFRTANAESPVEKCLVGPLKEKWFRDHAQSDGLRDQDRSCIYQGFHLYRLQTA